MESRQTRKIAVVGGGVAGIVASYLLQRRFEVSLFEKNDYIGGHTHTILIDDGPDAGTPVDTGFIVFNEKTYPNSSGSSADSQSRSRRAACPSATTMHGPA